MKKLIIILLSLLCLGGIAFLGYTIFQSQSVESIEIVGDVQTLYFANETTDVNFNDAKIKVNYKNGSMKVIDMQGNVGVNNFSTSVEKVGKMLLTYKTASIELDYYVVKNGMYYLSQDKTSKVNVVTGSYVVHNNINTYYCGLNDLGADITNTKEMIYFSTNGVCRYYTLGDDNNYYMNDGAKDKTYKYSILGNKLTVNCGANKTYEIVANFTADGAVSLDTTIYTTLESDPTFVVEKEVKSFVHYDMKTQRTLDKVELVSGGNLITSSNPVEFKVGDTYATSGNKIYLKATYLNDSFLDTVYVEFSDSMFTTTAQLDTTSPIGPTSAFCAYEGKNFILYYKVVAVQ